MDIGIPGSVCRRLEYSYRHLFRCLGVFGIASVCIEDSCVAVSFCRV